MRIVHVSCVSPPEIGGIGRIASDTVMDLKRRGVDAELFSLTTHAGWRFGNAGKIKNLANLVANADIVHLHYPFFGTAGVLAHLRRVRRIRSLVVTLHMDATATGLKGRIFDLQRVFFQDRILKSADVLIAASKDYIHTSSFQRYEHDIREIPFGIDADIFSPGVSTVRDELGIPANRFVVGFVGGMDRAHRFKGVDVLLRASAMIPECSLILVGDGELRSSYETHAETLGVRDRCFFLGKVDARRLVEVYRAMDVFAFPSTSNAEAFGLVALEAQACGVPVVASELPGVRTVVIKEETGFLIQPKDVGGLHQAIDFMRTHPEIRHKMGIQARAHIFERFTWKKYMDSVEEVYRQLV